MKQVQLGAIVGAAAGAELQEELEVNHRSDQSQDRHPDQGLPLLWNPTEQNINRGQGPPLSQGRGQGPPLSQDQDQGHLSSAEAAE